MVGCKSSTSSPVCHLFEAHKVGYSTMMHINLQCICRFLNFHTYSTGSQKIGGTPSQPLCVIMQTRLVFTAVHERIIPACHSVLPIYCNQQCASIRWRRCLVIETWGCSMNCFCCTIACESWWFVHWVLRSSGFCHYVLNLASIRCTLSGFYFQLAWSVGFPISGALRVGAKRAQKRANERKNMQTSAILKNGCFEISSLWS